MLKRILTFGIVFGALGLSGSVAHAGGPRIGIGIGIGVPAYNPYPYYYELSLRLPLLLPSRPVYVVPQPIYVTPPPGYVQGAAGLPAPQHHRPSNTTIHQLLQVLRQRIRRRRRPLRYRAATFVTCAPYALYAST